MFSKAHLEWLLIIIVSLSVLRCFLFAYAFSLESLQMDLSAFYTAGQALNAGLSPYRNHVDSLPPIWDGVDYYRHSRFLYPPLVANLFQPLANLPYQLAKFLWTFANLSIVIATLWFLARAIRTSRNETLIMTLIAAWFYPLLTYLERGQIDGITLLLVTVALVWISRRRENVAALAGVLLAVATLLKLHCVYIAPFLLIRHRWKVLLGYITTGVIILALTLLVSGSDLLKSYICDVMPRVSVFGEGGSEDMRLPLEASEGLRSNVPQHHTVKDGVVYRTAFFSFEANASLVRFLASVISFLERHFPDLKLSSILTSSALSIAVCLTMWCLMLAWQSWAKPGFGDASLDREMLYWQIVTIVILLSGPFTWVMNTVWLLPVALTLIHQWNRIEKRSQAASIILTFLGILMVAVPDLHGFPMLVPYGTRLDRFKYILGQFAVMIGTLGYLTASLRSKCRPVCSQPPA